MWNFLGWISGLGPTITSIFNKLEDARVALANAQNEKERIAAQERVATIQAQLEILKADPIGAFVRLAFTFPFVLYINKIILWDKLWTAGKGYTPPLGTDIWALLMMIAGFYFLRWTIGKFR